MKILEVVTEHTGPFKILFEVLKDMLTETCIEFRFDNSNKKVKQSTNKKQNKTKLVKKTRDVEEAEEEAADTEAAEEAEVEAEAEADAEVEAEVEVDEVDEETEVDGEVEEVEDDEKGEKAEKEEDDDDDKDKRKLKDKDGMRIMEVDSSKTVLINVKLDAKNFTTFNCKKNKLSVGVNLNCFYKLIKTLGKNDILTLYVEHDDKNILKIKIDNPEEKKNTVFDLKLLDLDEPNLNIPDTTFDAVITMNSQEFHKICREMNQIADYVEIKCLSEKILFTCKGDFANRTTTYVSNDTSTDEILVSIKHASITNKKAPQIVQGIYELKNLVLFSKCASLCNDIEIYMKNNYPLVIKYTVATLGRVLLCLSPINEEVTKNANYSDEEELYDE